MGLFASLTAMRTRMTPGKRVNGKSRYRGVEVVANGSQCCEAVQAIAGKRFLHEEIPELPLAGCDVGKCLCSYELFDDRRTDIRRASDMVFGTAATDCVGDSRRSSSSRRRIDD